jgi:hypothetical protein
MKKRVNSWVVAAMVLGGFGCAFTQTGTDDSMTIDIVLDETHLTVTSGGPILRYHYAGVPFKPYVQELYSRDGFNLLLDAPSDHLHHHGLMFAVAAEEIDFWAETETCGKQVHREWSNAGTLDTAGGMARASFSETVDWVRPTDNVTLLNEARTIATYRAADLPVTLVTWISALTPAVGLPSVTLTGSHYFGLGFRFPPSMDGIGAFRNAAGDLGEIVRGEERNGRATWSCYSAEVEGKPVTVAMFDDPSNARHPATWFTMPSFAYMSATLDLKTEPLVIEVGDTLTLRYGVAIWDTAPDDSEIEAMYQRWLSLPREDS